MNLPTEIIGIVCEYLYFDEIIDLCLANKINKKYINTFLRRKIKLEFNEEIKSVTFDRNDDFDLKYIVQSYIKLGGLSYHSNVYNTIIKEEIQKNFNNINKLDNVLKKALMKLKICFTHLDSFKIINYILRIIYNEYIEEKKSIKTGQILYKWFIKANFKYNFKDFMTRTEINPVSGWLIQKMIKEKKYGKLIREINSRYTRNERRLIKVIGHCLFAGQIEAGIFLTLQGKMVL